MRETGHAHQGSDATACLSSGDCGSHSYLFFAGKSLRRSREAATNANEDQFGHCELGTCFLNKPAGFDHSQFEFHKKCIMQLTQHVFPSCFAQKLLTNCFHHDSKVLENLIPQNWTSRMGGCSFGSFGEHVGGLEGWRVEFLV